MEFETNLKLFFTFPLASSSSATTTTTWMHQCVSTTTTAALPQCHIDMSTHIFTTATLFLATITHSSFKLYCDHHLTIFFFSLFWFFTVCISYLNWNLLFPSFFSLLLSFQAFHMTWYFFSFFHFFTCLLRFGHTFYLSKKSMLWKKIWIQVVPNKFTKLVYVGHHIAWHVQALPFIGKMIYII